MESQLFSLSRIFSERIFRIPDYQRGYAWSLPQLRDFWNDLNQIEDGENHYTGVIHLEVVPNSVLHEWQDDRWIIEDKSYEAAYVVDGQQRLTTSIILIQVIIETMEDNQRLNYTEKQEIQKKFIFESKDRGISRSYIFGYEKDNPSYEYLKTKIFCEPSSTDTGDETIYTQNLMNAKRFFQEKIKGCSFGEIETVFKKLTQQFLFNIFTISREIDVCIAFETMNNRGKRLSYLELLKNRLIFLSLKLEDPDSEKFKLRRTINDCWKSVYHNLGKNKENPLVDDDFLNAHWAVYNKVERRNRGSNRRIFLSHDEHYYPEYSIHDESPYSNLLRDVFIQKNLYNSDEGSDKIDLVKIHNYVRSLQRGVENWYQIHNPHDSSFDEESILWLEKLNRLPNQAMRPLMLSVAMADAPWRVKSEIYQEIERRIFLSGTSYIAGIEKEPINFVDLAFDIFQEEVSAKEILKSIRKSNSEISRSRQYYLNFRAGYDNGGYYKWPFLKYILFEYNLNLQNRSKTRRPKLSWREMSEQKSDYSTIEHIYPQNARLKYWTQRFPNMTAKQRDVLRNSIGNLLPLSRAKNSSLSNKSFPDKVDGVKDKVVGYRYGSYCEIEVASEDEWTPAHILKRGIKIIKFIESRWDIDFESDKSRINLLGLGFVDKTR